MYRTPQPTSTTNDLGHQREAMSCGQKQLLHICSKNFSDLYITHKNIWDPNQEICYVATTVLILSWKALSTSIT